MLDMTHYEGKGCSCYASSEIECCCEDADWTPKEVYELRERVKELEEALKANGKDITQ